MTFQKVMPNFLQQYAAAPDDGIAGALKRHAGADDREDREDGEDEAPVMVDALDTLTSKQREKELKKPEHTSALFKGGTSAASKFQDSAHRRVAEHQQQEERKAKAAEQAAADEAEAASGRHSFKAGVPSKRKALGGSGSSKEQKKGAKKGGAALSFSMDDEDE